MRDWTALLTDHERADMELMSQDFNEIVESDIKNVSKAASARRIQDAAEAISQLPADRQRELIDSFKASITSAVAMHSTEEPE